MPSKGAGLQIFESLRELLSDYADYKSIDSDDEEEFREHFKNLSLKEQRYYAESDEFTIENSIHKFEEEN